MCHEAYLHDRKQDPQAAHYSDVCPREDVAQGLTLRVIRRNGVAEEVGQALGLGLVMARRGQNDPRCANTKRTDGREKVEGDIAAEEDRPFLRSYMKQRSTRKAFVRTCLTAMNPST